MQLDAQQARADEHQVGQEEDAYLEVKVAGQIPISTSQGVVRDPGVFVFKILLKTEGSDKHLAIACFRHLEVHFLSGYLL